MKDMSKAKPREVEAYLRGVVLDLFGDEVENRASITAHRGYYAISLTNTRLQNDNRQSAS